MSAQIRMDPSSKDPLTGTEARQHLNSRIEELFRLYHRFKDPFSMLFIDVDYFKSINDAFGHSRGDEVLKELARRMQAEIREVDTLIRYGGDEFIVILPRTNLQRATVLANRIHHEVCFHPFPGTPPVYLTISIGVAACPEDGLTPETIFHCSDQRLYNGKRHGRNRIINSDSGTITADTEYTHARLIERDAELQRIHDFLDNLNDQTRAMLRLTGPPGSGQSRMLDESEKIARLRGYAVLRLCPNPALRTRSLGALDEASYSISDQLCPSAGITAYSETFATYLNGKAGLVVLVDGINDLDGGSLEYLQTLYLESNIQRMAIAFCDVGQQAAVSSFQSILPQDVIQLKPLSVEGLQVLLRQTLAWDPPTQFTTWLHNQTLGLPALVHQAVSYLMNTNQLHRISRPEETVQVWTFPISLLETSLLDEIHRLRRLPPGNISPRLEEFIGREQELRHIKKLVNSSPLVTILGSGGIGKSRFTLQAAAEMRYARPAANSLLPVLGSVESRPNGTNSENPHPVTFRDGTYAIPLASTTTLHQMIAAVAGILGLTLSSANETSKELLQALEGKQMLLVLDNFETVLENFSFEGCSFIHDILLHTPLHLLITSREKLQLPQERIFELHGLAFPALLAEEEIPPARMESFAAVQLFLAIARRVLPGYNLTPDDQPVVARICTLVEGMPLGIELAATWVGSLTCHEILDAIENHLGKSLAGIPTSLSEPVPSKPELLSIQAVFDSLWNHMSDHEQANLRRLGIFKARFNGQAAQHIAGASPFFLDALLNKSILHRSEGGYFEIHELFRQYLLARMHEIAAEEKQIRALHCGYFADFIKQRENSLQNQEEGNSRKEIFLNIENLRLAWEWSVQNHQFHEVNQMLDGLFRYYETGGWFHEAVHTAQQAVQILDTPGENNLTTDQEIALGRALIYQGRFDVHIGNYKTAEKSLSRGLEILTKIGQKKHIVFGLYEMAKLNQAFGKQSAARLLLEQCLPIYRELEDLGKIVDVYNNIGITYYHQEEYLAARDYFENSLVIAKLLGNQGRLSRAYNNLGDVARLMHDLTAASSYLRQSLSLCEDLGPSPLMGSILNTLGETHQELGDYTGAATYLHRGLRIAKRLQAVPLILEILVSVAVLWNAKKDQKAALPLLSLAYRHPATPRAIKKKAHRLLSNTKAGRAALAGIKVQLAAPDLNAMESLISEAMHSLSSPRE